MILWHFTKHGNFTVKSAYQAALSLEQSDRPSSSHYLMGKEPFCKLIFKLYIPSKIKFKIWRMALC